MLAVLLGSALAVTTASVVSAHATFDRAQVPADSDESLQLQVPVEQFGSQNERIETQLPGGFEYKSCAGPLGWTCEHSASTIVWTRRPGVGTLVDSRFDFAVRTPRREGTYLFKTIQTYSSGEEVKWVNEGEPEPAPRLQVVAESGGPAPTSRPPTPRPTSRPRQASPPTQEPANVQPSSAVSVEHPPLVGVQQSAVVSVEHPEISPSPSPSAGPSAARTVIAGPARVQPQGAEAASGSSPALRLIALAGFVGAGTAVLIFRRMLT